MKKDVLEEYMDQTIDDLFVQSSFNEVCNNTILNEFQFNDLAMFKNRFGNSKLMGNKKQLIGSLIRYNKAVKNDEEVSQLMQEKGLRQTYETESGKLVFTSPNMKLDNKEVRFISSSSKYCKDGYASMHNAGSLKNILTFYDMLKENNEKFFKSCLTDCCKWLYEDRGESIDKNYRWILENWLKIKNIYIYTLYSQGQADIYCDCEVDISKFKKLQDYLPKKSCTVVYVRANIDSGNMYTGQDILNDRTELWKLTPVKISEGSLSDKLDKNDKKVLKKEEQKLIDKFMPIIKAKEYRYYCIYNYLNPYKNAYTGAVGTSIGIVAGSPVVAGVAGGIAAGKYAASGHYTLYGSNVKPFSKNMLSKERSAVAGNPWKSEMKARQLKTSYTTVILKKSQIPSKLQKYVIE